MRDLTLSACRDRESSLLPETPRDAVEEKSFESQLRTREALDENRDTFAKTIDYLRKRLEILVHDGNYAKDDERSRLQADVNISKQCLDVCNERIRQCSKYSVWNSPCFNLVSLLPLSFSPTTAWTERQLNTKKKQGRSASSQSLRRSPYSLARNENAP